MPPRPIMTRKISPTDMPAVAAIHKAAYLTDHFSAHFTNTLLENMYAELCRENPFSLIAIDSSGQVLGFVVGHFAEQVGRARKNFVAANYLAIAATSLLHPLALLNKAKTRLRALFNRESSPSQARMRLTSIAVSPNSQKRAVGRALLDAFEDNLRQQGIFRYGLSVKGNNQPAVRFYQKNGFIEESRTPDGSIYYIKNL